MNLTNLFNFNYLLQNIKKSKTAITLFFIIVPVFTSLMLISVDVDNFEYVELGIINIVAMYIVPFILSVSLFGYVFKKNSVDFIGSMPISRKSIFITNTFGGIVIIFALQLATLLLTLLIGVVMKQNVFAGMAFDIFIYQTIAYIFVFVLSNLAMSVSGNILTKIVVTILIAFLIPFSTFFIREYDGTHNYAITTEYGSLLGGYSKVVNYTAPSLVLSGEYNFNVSSILKMCILSLAYFLVGLYMFDKRKMEIAGESFENKNTHLVVKSLTLSPLIALLISAVDYGEEGLITIVLAIIAIYYFIYDLITGKKMKFKDNVISLVLAVVALYGTYSVFIKIDNEIDREIKVSSIKEVIIEHSSDFKLSLTDQESIKDILLSCNGQYKENSRMIGVNVTVVRKDGARFEEYERIDISKLNEYVKEIYPTLLSSSNLKVNENNFELSAEEEKRLFESLKETLSSLNYMELQALRDVSKYTFTIYEYKNHDLIRHNFPIEINEEVFKILMDAYNRHAYEYLKTMGNRIHWFEVMSYSDKIDTNNSKGWWTDQAYEELYNFILEHHDDEITDYSNGIIIYGNDFRFYTDKVDEFIEKVYSKFEEDMKVDVYKYEDDVVDIETTTSFPNGSVTAEEIIID